MVDIVNFSKQLAIVSKRLNELELWVMRDIVDRAVSVITSVTQDRDALRAELQKEQQEKQYFESSFQSVRAERDEFEKVICEAMKQKPIYQAKSVGGLWLDIRQETADRHEAYRTVFAAPVPAMPIPKQEPVANWRDIPDDCLGRLLIGRATEGDQMLAYNAIDQARVYADLYVDFADMIEPYVSRGKESLLPCSVHGSFSIIFDHWLATVVNPVPAQAADIPEWKPIETAPKTGRKMLLSLENIAGKRRTIVGFWVERFSAEDNSEDWDLGEEKDGTYYWREGWYESMESHDDFSCIYAAQQSITHWMQLPAAPKP